MVKNKPKETTGAESMLDSMNVSLEALKEELKEFMKSELQGVMKKMEPLEMMMDEIKQLRDENTKKDQLLKELGNRVEELDQQARLNEVIVTGLKIKYLTYARAAAAATSQSVVPDDPEVKSVEMQVSEFMAARDIEVDFNNVEVCHLLPQRKDSKTRAVVLRFTNRKYKIALLKQGRMLKGSDVYINENLTKKNADIARKARHLKKNGKIQHTWTANCRIYIKTNGSSPEEVKTLQIRNADELEKFDH